MAKPDKPKPNDGNSEESLIALLKTVLTGMFKEVHDTLDEFRVMLLNQEQKQNERHGTLMTALEELTAAVNEAATAQTDLTTAVNAAIVQLGTPGATDAQILTAATAIRANTASDVALTAALKDAVNPPVEPPAPV
jgi:DNA uptake protein ComE-like DNA-binding protein